MEFFDVINTRKTIRKYTAEIPPQEDIKKIADAGRLAPSATNSQNWKFLAIVNPELKAKMAQTVADKFDKLIEATQDEEDKLRVLRSKNYSVFFKNAPVVFVILEEHRVSAFIKILEKNGVPKSELEKYDNRASILSMGAAIENMSLAAHALGYGTCWMCAPLAASQELKTLLDINPDDRIVTLLALGKPESDSAPQPPKKSIDEVFEIR